MARNRKVCPTLDDLEGYLDGPKSYFKALGMIPAMRCVISAEHHWLGQTKQVPPNMRQRMADSLMLRLVQKGLL